MILVIRFSFWVLSFPVLLLPAIVPRVSLEELADRAQSIVHGVVSESWCAWDDAHQIIWTHHRIAIRDSLKGSGGASLIVSEPGGTVGSISMVSSGSVTYAAGEEVVVFLYRTPIGYLRAVGLSQGKYSVGPSGRLRAGSGNQLVDPIGKIMARSQPAVEALDGLTLSQFRARVRPLINRPAAPSGR